MRDPSDTPVALRLRLRAGGYHPLPCEGKAPPLKGWQTKFDSNEAEIRLWDQAWHLAANTGLLTKFVPTLDIDITDPAAAEAVEALAREHFEEHGYFLVRVGQAPKRAVLLRTDEPFDKLVRVFTAPNGGEHKIEILANGQQVVAFGIHPTTQQPYRWHGGSPAEIAREDLPYVRQDDVERFLDAAAALLVEQFGFTTSGGAKTTDDAGKEPEYRDTFDWGQAFAHIHTGTNLHDTITAVAASFIAAGMSNTAAVERLRSLMTASQAPKDARWRERYNEVPRAVASARAKFGTNAEAQQQQRPTKIANAEELKAMTFDPIKYVVPTVLCEGLTLLCGKPKIGKSWFLLHAAIAVANGGLTLGEIHCKQGASFYCALEDNERRLRSRIDKLGLGWPKGFFYCTELPRLGAGGADIIRNWIQEHPDARLIVIDTLAMVRALKKLDESSYQSDYLALLELRALANEFGIAVAVSHHLRKAEADDPFDTISGTLGLTGAVDSMLVIKRDSYGGYVLHGKGRDLVEIEKALTFNRESCVWTITGEAVTVRRSGERQAVLDAIEEAKQPIGPNDIAIATRMKPGNVRFLLYKLAKEGVIENASYGRYQLKGAAEPPQAGSFRVLADCEPQTVCIACGQPGDVKRIKDGTRSGSQSETLHEGCAPAWFAKV
jgi:AAA domain/Bifunctional DNA primase/polymerase, N-terminal